MEFLNNEKNVRIGVSILTLIVTTLVGLMFTGILKLNFLPQGSLDSLPLVNAILNGTTSCLLIGAFWAIKNGNKDLHQKLMNGAILLSTLFLLCYVAYHVTHEQSKYGGEGLLRGVYLFILGTHILLASIIFPLVLITYIRALSGKFEQHRKIARITFPLWLYVTVTGVIVYIMMAPYYNH
jgi:putative membrane protein